MPKRLREQIQVNPIDTQTNVAVGIALPFNGNPVFRSNYTTRDQVKTNLINYFLTSKGERIMNPDFGGDLRSFIFEQMPDFDRLHEYITSNLEVEFPQIAVIKLDVNINQNSNTVNISLKYSVNNSSDDLEIQFHA